MTTFDHSQYRELGCGERILLSDYRLGEHGPIAVAGHEVGNIIFDSTEETYLRAVPAGIPVSTNTATEMASLVESLAASLGITTTMGHKALTVALENIKVLDSKQRDYGSTNISAFGEFGVLVRVTDKHARLKNLLTNVADPKNESVEDTWLDISNYAIIALLCRRGEWR